MQENISPEEKLLKIIKNGKPTQSEKDLERKAEPPKPEEKKQAPAQELKKEPAAKKAVAAPKKTKGKVVDVYLIINKLLVILVIVSAIYAVLCYQYPFKSTTDITGMEGRKGQGVLQSEGISTRPISYYTDVIGCRQIFKMMEPPAQKQAGPVKPKISLSQLLGGYTFVGIIFGDVPQVIVEEKKSGQSFYLVEGQFLGEIKIDRIQSGRVTISYEGETMDMSI